MKKILFYLAISISLLFTTSCKDDNDAPTPDSKTLVKSFNIDLSASNAVPIVAGRSENGTLAMSLYSDNSLEFTITINGLATTDNLTAAHLHSGNPVETGSIAIPLVDGTTIAFSGNTATGTITLTSGEVTALQGSDIYANIHSSEVAAGLLRGQVDQTLTGAYNIALSPDNQVPVLAGRSEDGIAYFRLVGTKMYYKVVVNNLDASDAISNGHIHEGTATENGGVFVSLGITANDQLSISKIITLTDTEVTKMNNDALYVNIHSNQAGGGLIRGQIR